MSTLKDPVGPKDRKVYLRRRLIVLLALLAVVAVVVLIIVRPGSSGGVADASQVEVPEDLVESPSPGADEEGGAAGESDDVAACAAGQLTVTPATDKGDYAAGEQPQLSLSVENTGEDPCSADLGSANLQFVIASGDDEVWRSADCQENPEHLAVILEPGAPLTTESIAWDRTRSSPETCDISRDPVSADGASYHLRTTAAGVQGTGTAQFLLY
ncbi:hypothetical protein [Leucobacter chromiiresistens]|uniref:DUF4232 domain-containing protein n=1 Tax=Leucobacter chromiiresistens TaxID=1079994 RepID=A0A147EKZ7_9MICO|nr:hypothetical protein [Leucobacter chromiiresistens]KTR85075.1 hypothetical protein NS354_09785 [Leucobacter chromiiresistens]